MSHSSAADGSRGLRNNVLYMSVDGPNNEGGVSVNMQFVARSLQILA